MNKVDAMACNDSQESPKAPHVSKLLFVSKSATVTVPLIRTGLNKRQFPLAESSTPQFLSSFNFSHKGETFSLTENDHQVVISPVADHAKRLISPDSPSPEESAVVCNEEHTADVRPSNITPLVLQNPQMRKRTPVTHEDLAAPAAKKPHIFIAEDVAENTTPPDFDRGSPPMSLPSPSVSPVGADPRSLRYDNNPNYMHIPDIIETFGTLPAEIKTYVMYNLLKSCDRKTLSLLSGIIVPALRCDILGLLPVELAYNVISYLDFRTLCNAAQVSHAWRDIVESCEWIWKDLLDRDGLGLESGEFARAKNEQWGYVGWGNSEQQLVESSSSSSLEKSISSNPAPTSITTPRFTHPSATFLRPRMDINLYKSIYRRKYLIRKNWMNSSSTPKHLVIKAHGNNVVTCLQFDDERIITGSEDHTVCVHSTETGRLLHRLEGHDGGVWALQYIHKRILVSGSTDRTVRVWDIEKAVCTHIFYGHVSTVRCLEIIEPAKITNRDGTTEVFPKFPIIVTGSRDTTLRMWKLPLPGDPWQNEPQEHPNPRNDRYFLRVLKGHTHSVRAISGYGDTLVSGSYDTTVRVWKLSIGECRWEFTGHAQRVYSALLDHKRNRCISGSMDWFVKVWCIETGTLLYTLEGHTSLVGLLDLNRTTLVSAAADSTLRVWDPETGASIHKLQGHHGAITCFQHDESKVVSGSPKTLKLWNIKTGKLVKNLLTGLSEIWQVCFDQRRCVAAVKRGEETFIDVMDFDYDPEHPPEPLRVGPVMNDEESIMNMITSTIDE